MIKLKSTGKNEENKMEKVEKSTLIKTEYVTTNGYKPSGRRDVDLFLVRSRKRWTL